MNETQNSYNTDFWQLQKENNKRFAFLIIIVTIVFWIIFYFLSIIFLYIVNIFILRYQLNTDFFKSLNFFLFLGVAAVIFTFYHYKYSVENIVIKIHKLLYTAAPDKNDFLHKQVLNILEELKIAFGYNKPIHLVIIPTLSKNVFTMGINKKNIIGVTEGLIFKFSREELKALIAQQLTHIVNNDTKIMTFICSTYNFIKDIASLNLSKKSNDTLFKTSKYHPVSAKECFGVYLILMMPFLFVAELLMKCMISVISRNREYYADYKAVEVTRNPMALAEALYKISESRLRYSPFDFLHISPLFIVPPDKITINEQTGLIANFFSTHPPVKTRIEQLLHLSGMDKKNYFYEKDKKKYFNIKSKKEDERFIKPEINLYYSYINDEWKGPYMQRELFELDFVLPDTFINIAGTEIVQHFNRLFPDLFKFEESNNSELCPRCLNFSEKLYETSYEYVPVKKCKRCKGILIESKKIIRIINRNIEQFSTEEKQIANEHKNKIISLGLSKTIKNIDNTKKIICPKCKKEMYRCYFDYQDYVVVDRCIYCNLIWFDRYELEMIQYFIEKRNLIKTNNKL